MRNIPPITPRSARQRAPRMLMQREAGPKDRRTGWECPGCLTPALTGLVPGGYSGLSSVNLPLASQPHQPPRSSMLSARPGTVLPGLGKGGRGCISPACLLSPARAAPGAGTTDGSPWTCPPHRGNPAQWQGRPAAGPRLSGFPGNQAETGSQTRIPGLGGHGAQWSGRPQRTSVWGC